MKGKKDDIVVIGELNIDLILWDIPMPENEKEKLAKDMRFALGSSSAITAHNLSGLGDKVVFIGKAGLDNFGDFILKELQKGGVDTSYVIRKNDLKTGATIVLANPPKRAMLTYMGAMIDLTIRDIDWTLVSRAKHLHLGSFFLQTGLKKDVPKLFSKAKELGLTTSMDTNWDPEEKWGKELFNALAFTDIFLPNDDEAFHITGKNTIPEALAELNKSAKIVAIKQGQKGSTVSVKGQIYSATGFSVQAIETTGAGDSFNAGFIHKFIQGADWHTCLDYANACGALAVTTLGGTGAFKNRRILKERLNTLIKLK